MKKAHRLTLLAFLALCSMTFTACSQDEVALTIYVHESDLNGTLISGVLVTGKDAAGMDFAKITDSNGAATVNGQPGAWQFSFSKEGYNPLSLSYDVAETQEAAAYLTKTASPQREVSLTVYVHEGDLNGTLISGVMITGKDAAGMDFAKITDSNGTATVNGQPGAWQFSFSKEGYDPLSLSYDVAETEEAAAYLTKAA